MDFDSMRHLRILTATVLAVVIGAAAVAGLANNASAGSGPLPVYGYVLDSEGTPVEGANVVVEVLRTGATLSDTTDSSGRYDVSFDLAVWVAGDTVESTATFESLMEIETGVAPEFGTLRIDLQFAYAIPEFGSVIGVLVATVLMGSVAIISMRRRRNP